MGLLEAQLPKLVKLHKQDIQNAPLLLLDGNMPQHTIAVSLIPLRACTGDCRVCTSVLADARAFS